MKILSKIGRLLWNKYTKAILTAAALCFVLWKIGDCWDFAYSRGSADPQEMAREEKLWKYVHTISNISDEYHQTKGKLAKKLSAQEDQYLVSYDINYFIFQPLDFAAIRKSAADCLAKSNQSRQQLQHIPDTDHFGYRDEMLMLLAFNSRDLYLSLMGDELKFNMMRYYNTRFTYEELKDEYCKLYDRENKDNEFKYPDRNYMAGEDLTLSLSSSNSILFCIKEHGGYRLWQGCSSASVQADIEALFGSNCNFSFLDPWGPLRVRYLERRRQSGSKYAALSLPPARLFSLPLLLNKYLAFMCSLGGNRRPEVVSAYAKGAKNGTLANFAAAQTREDRLWRITNYLAVTADNYLWTVKFNADHKLKPSKLRQIQIMPKFGKNSPEMKQFNRNFTADLQYCRRKIKSEEFQSLAELKKTSLEFCSAAEAIWQTWERYRQDKMDYKTFYKTLQHDEAVYEKKRLEVLKQRWHYLSSQVPDNYIYIILSLRMDGVPDPALQRLTESKLRS